MSHLLLSKKSLYIAIMATGMICTYNISMAYADQLENKPAINIGEVNGQSSTAEKNKKDNKKVDLKSPVQTVHITQRDIEDNTPSGGSMVEAIAATTPGFQARRTGTASGANRYQIRLNGIQIGFDETGQAEMNGNQILMDGIPLNNPLASYHGFSTAELPISSMFSGINVVYGPGTAKQHWFDSMGGTIDFRTKSSGENPSAFVDIGAGSFNAYNASTGISTGSIDGWKTYIAGGYTRTGQARISPSLTGPSESSAIFVKTQKKYQSGKFSAGFYFNHTEENRPHLIPVYPFAGGSVNGNGVEGPALSQVTSGFYYTPSSNLWRKHEKYLTYLGYLKLTTDLSSNVKFHNAVWYRAGNRLKVRVDSYVMAPKLDTEYYPTSSGNFGYRGDFTINLPWNKIDVGGYYQQTTYDSSFAGYASFIPGHELGSNSPVYYRDDHDHWSAASAFLQDKITPVSFLTITPGLNLINYHISINNVTSVSSADLFPNDTIGDFPTVAGDTANFTKIAPSVAVNATITPALHAFATWSQNYQTQIDSAYGEGASHPVIAPTQPAKINFYMAGLKYAQGPLEGQVSFVHQKLSNLAVQITQAESQNIIVEPANETINGLNFLLAYGHNLGFNARLLGSILHGTENTVDAAGQAVNGARVTGLPTYNINFGLGYRMYADQILWSIRALDNYQSATYLSSDITASPTTLQLPFSAVNLVNLSLSARTTMFDHDIPGLKLMRVSLMLDNLLNRKYNVQGYVSAGGNYGAGSAGSILASPGTPRAVYASITASF
ncbi:TonB-dependent receptor [Acidithiobacillus sp.]|uniref:TonB-dependent receptor n=1 Tax=Acidithiobacillus sp. TaxID=1872118 RepID=UPI00262FCA87|nr:TonB-dependent receptor plug domain-containing protein [Acidithiobacillus sp.]MDD5278139.1 TonB-dependent receptor plug domain-containing protein [Acidithiobacillus sp.]